MKHTKTIPMLLQVTVPVWMTATQARREIRTLVNEQCGYLSCGPNGEEVVVRAKRVRKAPRVA